jgi:hypothetical protein
MLVKYPVTETLTYFNLFDIQYKCDSSIQEEILRQSGNGLLHHQDIRFEFSDSSNTFPQVFMLLREKEN